MKFPYGIANFYDMITEDYLYIDRTDRIRLLENAGKTLLFLRPRRFGKSLLLSTLENYYDVKRADEFERLFGHLAIGKDPTPKHNQYIILKWNFSVIATIGDEFAFQQALFNHINASIRECILWYDGLLPDGIEINHHNALSSLQALLTAVQTTPYKLYLLVDEYDSFTNTALTDRLMGATRNQFLLQGEEILKTVFNAVKAGMNGHGLDRVFLTGIAPVVLSDVKDVSLSPELHDLCGFREDEIVQLAQQIGATHNLTQAQVTQAVDTMRTYYKGYSFTYDTPPTLYNSTLVLYFLEHWQERCAYPRTIFDKNLATGQKQFVSIASMLGGKEVLVRALSGEEPVATCRLSRRFGVKDMLKETLDSDSIIRLLYYFGILTLTGERTPIGDFIMRIPNLVIQQLYVDRIREALLPVLDVQEAKKVAEQFYTTGDIGAVCAFIEQKYFPLFNNRDYHWMNELTFKAMFMTMLANTFYYQTISEMPLHRGYSGLTMLVCPNKRRFSLLDFLLEFKYASLKDVGLSGEQVRAMSTDELAALPLVQERMTEARGKLKDYRQTLLDTHHHEELRLRCFSVVAVGYERFVWEELHA